MHIAIIVKGLWPFQALLAIANASRARVRNMCGRVLARISKMPVQNNNFKNFARPDLATYILQILITATFNSLVTVVCQKGQLTLQLFPRRWFVWKISGYYTPKVKVEKSS